MFVFCLFTHRVFRWWYWEQAFIDGGFFGGFFFNDGKGQGIECIVLTAQLMHGVSYDCDNHCPVLGRWDSFFFLSRCFFLLLGAVGL